MKIDCPSIIICANLPILKSLTLIISALTLLLCKMTFTGFGIRTQDIFGEGFISLPIPVCWEGVMVSVHVFIGLCPLNYFIQKMGPLFPFFVFTLVRMRKP